MVVNNVWLAVREENAHIQYVIIRTENSSSETEDHSTSSPAIFTLTHTHMYVYIFIYLYIYIHYTYRGELSNLAPLGSENISVPYFKQCFFRGGGYCPPD